jgi:pimeloyl-ACP methyl ester carboxylesterase
VTSTKNIIISSAPSSVISGLKALKDRADMCSLISSITTPVLILCGEEDVITPPKQSELLHQRIAQSELYLIPGAGHLSNLENPELFNMRLDQFVSTVLSGPDDKDIF